MLKNEKIMLKTFLEKKKSCDFVKENNCTKMSQITTLYKHLHLFSNFYVDIQ